MTQPSIQNLPGNFAPAQQNLQEALEPVEICDRILSQSEWIRTHSSANSSVKSTQSALNTPINAELLSVQSDDLTIMQVPTPLQAEDGNTIMQIPSNPRLKNSPPSVVLSDRASLLPQKSGLEPVEASSHIPPESFTPNYTAQNDSENLDVAITGVQNRSNTLSHYSDLARESPTNQTIIQYSDSALHNPADRTVYQAIMPSAINLDQTIYQLGTSQSSQSSTLATVPKNWSLMQLFHPSIFRDVFRGAGSFTTSFRRSAEHFFDSIWRKIDPRQLRSPGVGTILDRTNSINRSPHNTMTPEGQPSADMYHKNLRELDRCRLSFAKELARNGKLRDAIALAEQISQTSQFFKDSQTLIRSWKQF